MNTCKYSSFNGTIQSLVAIGIHTTSVLSSMIGSIYVEARDQIMHYHKSSHAPQGDYFFAFDISADWSKDAKFCTR